MKAKEQARLKQLEKERLEKERLKKERLERAKKTHPSLPPEAKRLHTQTQPAAPSIKPR